MKRMVTRIIRAYQAVSRGQSSSPLFFGGFSGCRSWPSCSEYAIDVIERDGVLKGTTLAIARIARCNPLWPAQNRG